MCVTLFCFFSNVVAKIGNFTVYITPGEVWRHRPTQEYKPASFPQSVGDPQEECEPDRRPYWAGWGEQPSAARAASADGLLQGPLLLGHLSCGPGPSGLQCILPPHSQPRTEGQLPGPGSQRTAKGA